MLISSFLCNYSLRHKKQDHFVVSVQQIFIHVFNFIKAEHIKFLQNAGLKSVRILLRELHRSKCNLDIL